MCGQQCRGDFCGMGSFQVQHVEMKCVFTFQPMKPLVSTTVKGTKPAATPFKDGKATITLFSGDGTHCFAEKLSHDIEYEQPFPFFEEICPPITVSYSRA